jgi:uncharacterized protein (DUF302 family)
MIRHLPSLFAAILLLASCASFETQAVAPNTHPITSPSEKSFDQTLESLQQEIESRGLKIFAVIDHAQGAASVGKEIRPTVLVIFGSPKAGTPLIEENQLIAIALPLKALVWQRDDGITMVTMSNIHALAEAFNITENSNVIGKIDTTLQAIKNEAIAPVGQSKE